VIVDLSEEEKRKNQRSELGHVRENPSFEDIAGKVCHELEKDWMTL
jgi:hypothetical protein